MAGKDQIDLIKEFREEQRDNDYIILTTFNFDPFFFDTYLLNNLRYHNPNSEIIVLIDAEEYEKSYENFTDITGKDYHLIPVYVKGVFHPKMFLFLSTLNEKLTLYIGSGNLTLPGITKNAELISKTTYDLKNQYSDIKEILDFLNGLESNFIYERKVLETLENLIQYLSLFDNNEIINSKFSFLNNLNEGIIPQIFKELEIKNFEEIIMLAPFISSNPILLEEMKKNIDFDKVSLILPKDNHNLENADKYVNFALNNSIELEIKEGTFKEDSARRFHSKLLYLKGSINYLLIGSANLTISAMLETADKGNLEFSVLYKDIDASNILDNINSKLMEDMDEISPIKPDFPKYSLLKVFSADYNSDTGYLVIETEKINDMASFNLKIDESNEINKKINLDEGKIEIKIIEGIPKEFEIICGKKHSKRRIFYDRGYFFRNLPRSANIPINEVNSKISDYNITTPELLNVLIGMVKISDRPKTSEKEVMDKENITRTYYGRTEVPSHVRSLLSHSIKSLTESHNFLNLEKILKGGYYTSTSKERKNYDRLNKKITPKKMINDIKKLNELINYISEKSSKSNEQLILQSCFIQLFLKYTQNSVNLDALKDFRIMIKNNMNNITNSDFSEDSAVTFFQNLLALNYLYNCNEFFRFKNNIFKYDIILNKQNYFRIKRYIKGLFEAQFDQKGFETQENRFNKHKFCEYYLELVNYIFDSDTVEEGLEYIINSLENEKGEFGLVLYTLGNNLANGTEDNPPRFRVGDEFKHFFKSINDK